MSFINLSADPDTLLNELLKSTSKERLTCLQAFLSLVNELSVSLSNEEDCLFAREIYKRFLLAKDATRVNIYHSIVSAMLRRTKYGQLILSKQEFQPEGNIELATPDNMDLIIVYDPDFIAGKEQ